MSTNVEREAGEVAESESKPPFLRRVRIRGYKSIEFCDVSLEPLTILVGRNASGKSNFLDALAFVRDAMETNIPEAVRRHGGWSSILSRTAGAKRIAFEVELTPASNGRTATLPDIRDIGVVYGFELETGQHDQPSLIREYLLYPESRRDLGVGYDIVRGEWFIPRSPTLFPINLPAIFPEYHAYRDDRFVLSMIRNELSGDVADGLRFMGFYNFNPDAIRQILKPDFGVMLARDGKNLASLIETVRHTDESVIERVTAYLSTIVPDVARFDVVRLWEYLTIRFALRPRDGSSPQEFDAACMSDGTLRALAALMAAFQIHLPFGPTVVGIEEPETALHPAAMRALVDALDEATLSTQVLLTTHSADLLDNPTIRPENVRVVRMIDGRTVIGPVDAASAEIVRRKLDTLGGLERQNQLEPDLDDQDRQQRLARNGTEAAP